MRAISVFIRTVKPYKKKVSKTRTRLVLAQRSTSQAGRSVGRSSVTVHKISLFPLICSNEEESGEMGRRMLFLILSEYISYFLSKVFPRSSYWLPTYILSYRIGCQITSTFSFSAILFISKEEEEAMRSFVS